MGQVPRPDLKLQSRVSKIPSALPGTVRQGRCGGAFGGKSDILEKYIRFSAGLFL